MTVQTAIEVHGEAPPQILPLLAGALHGAKNPAAPVPAADRAVTPRRTRQALMHQLAMHAVAGRIVIEHGGSGGDDGPWQRTSIIPATLAAIRDAMDFNGWVRIVLDPQRADFERASDHQRIKLSLEGVGFAPRRDWQRIFALTPWGFA